jgi:hypothetical protein
MTGKSALSLVLSVICAGLLMASVQAPYEPAMQKDNVACGHAHEDPGIPTNANYLIRLYMNGVEERNPETPIPDHHFPRDNQSSSIIPDDGAFAPVIALLIIAGLLSGLIIFTTKKKPYE